MLDGLLERWAARRDPRFRAFVEAKDAYESYIDDLPIAFDQLTAEHYARGRSDRRLAVARRGFVAAIEMSESAGALADAAVAKYQLGLVYHASGDLDSAAALIHAALDVLDSLTHRNRAADTSGCHYHLGTIALKQGQLGDAVRELRCSRRLYDANGDLSGVDMCDRALAKCAEVGADIEADAAAAVDRGDWDVAGSEAEPAVEAVAGWEPEGKPRAVRHDQRQLIWLVSYSIEANDALMAHLSSLGEEFGRPVAVSRAAFGAVDPERRRLSQPEPDQHLCAAILALEKPGLRDRSFQELTKSCIERVLALPDFRLLVYLTDMTLDELRDMADREPLVATLFDTTQIAEASSLDQLRRALVPYVRRVEDIRAAARWRALRLRLAVMWGRLATTVLVGAVSIALLGFPAWLLKAKLAWLGPHAPELSALVLGMLAFPLQAPLVFLLLRGLRATALAPRDNVMLMRWAMAGAVIMLGANHLQHAMGGPSSWIVLGLAMGVQLDAIRRGGYQARRQMIDVEALIREAADPATQDPKTTVLRGDPLNPLTCPLLPALSARIFISYTRSSAKGTRLASELCRQLKDAGASPFLDRASIPVGASWRRSLNRHIGDCDVLVCILDGRSVQRPWVAAELLAALEARRLTGLPHIVLLMDPGVSDQRDAMLPVFCGVVAAAAEPAVQGRPQIVQLVRQTPSSLAWGLAPGRFLPTAVFTRTPTLLFMLALSLLGWIGGLGIVVGPILGFLAMLDMMAGYPFVAEVVRRGWLGPLALLTAYWLGFTARATIAWGFERAGEREMGMTIPAIATLGAGYALVLLVPKVSVLLAAWSGVLVIAGWMMVASATRVAAGDIEPPLA